MKRVFSVKLSAGAHSHLRYEVVAENAVEAIRKAIKQSKRDTSERHSLVEELTHRGEAL